MSIKLQPMEWDLASEYPSVTSHEFLNDWQKLETEVLHLESNAAEISPVLTKALNNSIAEAKCIELASSYLALEFKSRIVSWNLNAYLHFRLSVDAHDAEAKTKSSQLSILTNRLTKASAGANLFIKSCSEDSLKLFFNTEYGSSSKYYYTKMRINNNTLLTEPEEKLIIGLSKAGHHSWNNLYNTISGQMKCSIKYTKGTETVGLATAHSLTRSDNEEVRKLAWNAIQESWMVHQETAAAVINNLADWRHEVNKSRSSKKEVHFLDTTIKDSSITNKALEAMMLACQNNINKIRLAPQLMAKLLNKPKLDPWDLLAASPVSASSELKTFDEGISILVNAVSKVHPEMGEFAQMMKDKNWIEARLLPNKASGAYCGGFAKSTTPRVFMSYRGSNNDIVTLAHELGHAFHSWKMREMPKLETMYPMTLAETASVFAETVVQDSLMLNAKSNEEKIEYAWGNAERAMAFLINIPARFDFEKKVYEEKLNKSVSVNELCEINDWAWTKWYGDTLTHNDKLFWAHKQHFHMSGVSFYNHPYTFGYLFSLAIYAKQKELGSEFYKVYVNILQDTGRMSANELVKKHLGEDIEDVTFWQKSIDIVLEKITELKVLTN